MSDLVDFWIDFGDCEPEGDLDELRDEFYERVLEELDVFVGRPFVANHFEDNPDPNSVMFRAEFEDFSEVGSVVSLIEGVAEDVYGCGVEEVRLAGFD